jgi:hypothetical protein
LISHQRPLILVLCATSSKLYPLNCCYDYLMYEKICA